MPTDRLSYRDQGKHIISHKLLVVGATALLRHASAKQTRTAQWIQSSQENKPKRVISVAFANKTARIAEAVISTEEGYKPVVTPRTMSGPDYLDLLGAQDSPPK